MQPIDPKYRQGDLKEYQHWLLSVSFRQHTLGSAVIIAKRDIERISELTDQEFSQLRQVMKEYEQALRRAEKMRPDRFNYLQLGNSWHQLHFHCIPRYASGREFQGRTYQDKTFGSPPIFAPREEEMSVEEIVPIRDYIAEYLEG